MDLSVNKARSSFDQAPASAPSRPTLPQSARDAFAAVLQKQGARVGAGPKVPSATQALTSTVERAPEADAPRPRAERPRADDRAPVRRDQPADSRRADDAGRSEAPVVANEIDRPVDAPQTEVVATDGDGDLGGDPAAQPDAPVATVADQGQNGPADQARQHAALPGAATAQDAVAKAFVQTAPTEGTGAETTDAADSAAALAAVPEAQAAGPAGDGDDVAAAQAAQTLQQTTAAGQQPAKTAAAAKADRTGDRGEAVTEADADGVEAMMGGNDKVKVKVVIDDQGAGGPDAQGNGHGFGQGAGAGGSEDLGRPGSGLGLGTLGGTNQGGLGTTLNPLNPQVQQQGQAPNGVNAIQPGAGQPGAQPVDAAQVQAMVDQLARAGLGAGQGGTAAGGPAAPQTQGPTLEPTPQVGAGQGPGQAGQTGQAQAARPPQPARPPVPAHQVMEQVKVNITRAVNEGTDKINIQLKPEHLGRIDVKLELQQNGQVQAVVTADRPETLDILRQDAKGLEKALNDAGLRTDSNSLSFNLRGEQQQAEAFDRGGRGEGQGGGRGHGAGDDAGAAPEDRQTLAQQAREARAAARGGVDVRI